MRLGLNIALGKTPYPHSLSISSFLRTTGDCTIFAATFPHLKQKTLGQAAVGHTMVQVHPCVPHRVI
jgi:hypothetical protein